LEQKVKAGLLVISEGISQFRRDSESHHEVFHRQEFFALFVEPGSSLVVLAFWTHAVMTRMVTIVYFSTGFTVPGLTTEVAGPACEDVGDGAVMT